MDEAEVVFEEVVVGLARVGGWIRSIERWGRPEDIVVVGEGGEEDSEEEAGCWEGLVSMRCSIWCFAWWLEATHGR